MPAPSTAGEHTHACRIPSSSGFHEPFSMTLWEFSLAAAEPWAASMVAL